MDEKKLLRRVDHTLLKQAATWKDVQNLCDEAIAFQTASVCIAPVFVKQAAEYVNGQMPVCTVIGFPNGTSTRESKMAEAAQAVRDGASELDMVIWLGAVKTGQYDLVGQEIEAIKEICGERILKVIVETCFLSKEEKVRLCQVVSKAGADYIKTSTGFGSGGAAPEDVKLFRLHLAPEVKIKASGGIRTLEDAAMFLDLGADRLGASALVPLVKGRMEKQSI